MVSAGPVSREPLPSGPGRRRRRELWEEQVPLPPAARSDADSEAAALDSEVREELQSALQNVRADHRTALVLRRMEGLSYAEVAEAMQAPSGTAKGWASRGRAAMLVVLTEARSNGPLSGKTVRPDSPWRGG